MVILFCFLQVEYDICNDAEEQRASDRGQGDLTKGDAQSTDAGDQDRRNDEKILALAKIDLLNHLQTRYCDKAVECNANAAHYAVGDRSKEGYEGTKERDDNRHDRRRRDRHDRCVFRDGNASDRLTVGGVWATAEECACNRTNTVTEKGAVESGVFEKILINN